jgi:hypothetical protein
MLRAGRSHFTIHKIQKAFVTWLTSRHSEFLRK